MTSTTVPMASGVSLPSFPLATGDLLHAIENSGSVERRSTDDAGKYYSMAMASVILAAEVQESSVIVIPLTAPRPDEALDFTFVAAADCMFFQLHRVPHSRCTYGHCAAYFTDAPNRPVEVGAVFKFLSLTRYLVDSKELAAASASKLIRRGSGHRTSASAFAS
jgi:hypothetical protein